MEALAYFKNPYSSGLNVEDVENLYRQSKLDDLDNVVIVVDQEGNKLTTFSDDEWDLSIFHHRHDTDSNAILKFGTIASTSLKRELKLAMYAVLHHPVGQKGMLKVSTIKGISTSLTKVANYLEANGADSLTKINKELFDEIMRFFGENLSKNYLYQIIFALNKVYLLGPKLGFETQIYIDNPRYVAKSYVKQGKKISGQFAALPTKVLANLISYLIDQVSVIEKNLDALVNAQKTVSRTIDLGFSFTEEIKLLDELKSTPFWRFVKLNADEPVSPSQSLQKIFSWAHQVCFITCIAFTGMRKSDAFELQCNSYGELVLSDGTRVSVLYGKTHKMADGPGKPEKWVAADITEKAVRIAAILSEWGRHQAGQALLSTESTKDRMKFERFSKSIWMGNSRKIANRSLQEFSYLIQDWGYKVTLEDLKEHQILTPYPIKENVLVGELWPLSAHQLRRSLVVFAIRYDLASIPAFKQQYKHLCSSMTRHYARQAGAVSWLDITNGSESRRRLTEELQQERYIHQTSIDFDLHCSNNQLYGKGGEKIMQMRESQVIPKIYRSKESLLRAHVEGKVSIHRTFIGWCVAGYQCKMDSIFDVSSCFSSNCENLVMTEEDRQNLKKIHHSLCKSFNDLPDDQKQSSYFVVPITSEIKAVEHLMQQLSVDFDAWQQPHRFDYVPA